MIGKQGLVTVGFVSHHAEALPFIREQMERHETLVLEEPPSPGFPGMLSGVLSLDDYLLEIDSEFPRFDRLLCGALREFHGAGRRIVQVEPYLERLIEIHERFAEGKTVADVTASDSLRDVYRAERAATGALIAYYFKLIETEELLPGDSLAPHSEDEMRVGGMVDRLSFHDCEELFNAIRLLKRDLALQTVEDYGASKSEMT